MPHPRDKKTRFLKETSDRSGFDNFDGITGRKKWTSISQSGLDISPDEYDQSAPSKKSLGGTDITRSGIRTNWDTTDSANISRHVTQLITEAGGIALDSEPWIRIAGTATTTNISANPQISAGKATKIISIECTSNNVILEEGNGIAMHASAPYTMDSGSIFTCMYDGTDSLWRELSRAHRDKSIEG